MRRLVAMTMVVALAMGLTLVVAACGSEIAGTYTAESDDPEFETAELVMNEDETFELSATIPETEETVTFKGTWTVDGDTITIRAEGLNETETGTVEDGRLVFDEVTWVRQ